MNHIDVLFHVYLMIEGMQKFGAMPNFILYHHPTEEIYGKF
jgi:hypothetical protein